MSIAERPDGPQPPLRFGLGGRFDLRPAEYRLLVDGETATLGGRALDLLIALAARPGMLMTKGELLDLVWPGLVVEENNLRVQINALRRVLGEDAIATVPGRGYRLSAQLHAQPEAITTAGSSPAQASAASAASSQRLFGRAADLSRLEGSLREGAGRCVTLVGMPGVGKSSLARVALARWPAPGAWVDLAPLTQGAQVTGAIARALGAQHADGDPAEQVLRALPSGAPLLLVLDNAEHLIDACARWATQSGGAGGAQRMHLLVTSQRPLSVDAEQVQRLEPLQAADGALALLVERIRAADQRFEPTAEKTPLLTTLCRQLDGLPLALEMAAARVPLMGLRGVVDALGERFALLARARHDSPARHRTLRHALDWSHGLLSAPEQRLFRALGVFAGGFTLDLAATLTADEHVGRWDVIDGLATLVERSLVTVSADDPPRYQLLETMRAFALEQLSSPAAADDRASLRRRHAAAMLALFSTDESEAACLAEMENAREAFSWARANDLGIAAQLGARAALVVGFTTWRQEVTEWMLSLETAMRSDAGQALPRDTRARWWSMLAYLLNVRRDRAAGAAARQAVSLWRALGQASELQAALGHWVRSITEPGPELDQACAELQRSAAEVGDSPKARLRVQGALAEAARVRGDSLALLACREQELMMSRELGWADMEQAAGTNVCAVLVELGRHEEAAGRARALIESIDVDGGDTNGNLPWALNVLLESLTALGRLAEAKALVPRSIATGRRFGTTVAWQGILVLVAAEQRFNAAGRLVGYMRKLWTAPRASPDRDELDRLARISAVVQAQLGVEASDALAAEGKRLDDNAAATLAAGDTR